MVTDATGAVVARFGITGHRGEVSWTVLRADLDEDQFHVTWRYAINGVDVTTEMLQFEHAEHDYRKAAAKQHGLQSLRDEARDTALARLSQAGLSQRVMSEMVGVSQQRVNQILRADRAPHTRASAS